MSCQCRFGLLSSLILLLIVQICKIHVDYMDQTGTACLIIFVFNSIKSTHRMDQCVSFITVCTVFRPSIYYIKEVYIYIFNNVSVGTIAFLRRHTSNGIGVILLHVYSYCFQLYGNTLGDNILNNDEGQYNSLFHKKVFNKTSTIDT